jgi:hypothetical protein
MKKRTRKRSDIFLIILDVIVADIGLKVKVDLTCFSEGKVVQPYQWL